jgi:hypothetical protein
MLASISAHAEMTLMGMGARTCSEFAKDYQESPQAAETLYVHWALGFMSGINQNRATTRKNLDGITSDDKEAFIRRYCNDHPLVYYYEAVRELYSTLPDLKEKKD